MTEEEQIRKYLLNELTEAERQEVEKRMLTDKDFFDRVELAEGEMVDEYAWGELSDSERKAFERSFLSTPEGREQVDFARTMREYVLKGQEKKDSAAPVRMRRAAWWQPSSYPIPLQIAASVILMLGLGVVIWRAFFYQSEVDKGIAALREAYRGQRPLEARISGFDYAPPIKTRGDGQEGVDYVSRDRAERILLDAVRDEPGARSHHALGRFYLARREFDKAIDQFGKALEFDAADAQTHADLGAALFEKGKANLSQDDSGRSMEDFARSLEHLNRALELDGGLLAALFNRALLYESMKLPQQAEEGWRKYLEKDASSKWADEARQHLKSLEEQKNRQAQNKEQLFQAFLSAYETRDDAAAWQAFSRSRFYSGNFIVGRLLDSYLDAAAKGQQGEAQSKLQMLAYAGEMEEQQAGDRFTSDLARFYRTATAKQFPDLIQARELAESAREHYNQSKLDKAIELYTEARDLFEKLGNSCEARLVDYWIGHCLFQQPNTEKSLAAFQQLARICEGKNYKWLHSVALNGLVNIQILLAEYSKAIEYCNRSLRLSQEISDDDGILRSITRLATIYHDQALGRHHESLLACQRGLDLASRLSAVPSQAVGIYAMAAFGFHALGFQAAALDYQKEALRLSIQAQNPLMMSRYHAQLGIMYGRVKNYSEAFRNVELGLDIGRRLQDETIGREMIGYASLNLGHLYRETGDFSRAIASYNEAIQTYSEVNRQPFLYLAHKGRLLSYIAQGDDPAARQELHLVISLSEEYRSRILEESNRNSFFDMGQDIYDIAIAFAYSRMNDLRKAFEYSETCRARSLLDAASTNPHLLDDEAIPELRFSSASRPLTLTEIQERLPDQAQIVQYAVLEDRILIWVISGMGVAVREKQIGLDDLNKEVASYLRAISRVPETEERALKEGRDLYDLLIGPVESLLDRKKQICIVPDKILNHLPFGALISPTSGKYLIEDYSILISPSSSIFLRCCEAARQKEGTGNETLLSVGNPHFDRHAFPSLPDLPSAAKEASEIAAYYNPATLLIGNDPGKSQVTALMAKSDVAHFALHYVADDRSPMLSSLLLAREPAGTAQDQEAGGTLRAYEIYKWKRPKTRLVVLSACQTGIERYYKGEGAIGMARPFLAAGIPLVVASLWPVDSDSTTELMIGFHRHRKRTGLSTIEAMRQTQLEMLRNSTGRYCHPYYWASFAVLGGDARF